MHVGLVRQRAELIKPRIHDPTHEMLEVKAMTGEIHCQCVEQLRVDRRVGRPKVIHRMHNPTSKELSPNPVGHCPGEEGILRCQQPLGQCLPRIGAGGDI